MFISDSRFRELRDSDAYRAPSFMSLDRGWIWMCSWQPFVCGDTAGWGPLPSAPKP